MSDMSKFKVGAKTYDIKDEKSRGTPLTWAKYQALSYEEQHNGTAYYITDMDAVYPVDHELNANSRNAVANDIVTQHILAMENVLGAKNLADIPDKTLSASGFVIPLSTPIKLPAGDYILTFDFSGSSADSEIIIEDSNDSILFSSIIHVVSGTNKLYMSLQTESAFISYYSHALGDYSKFMIRDARITDPTYVPHAMTNEQLTERVESIVGLQDQSVFAGDVNTLGSGIYRVNTSNSFNLPDTTTAAWIILSSFDDSFGVPFGIQLAFGYSPNSLYFRLNWAGWQGWKKVD